MAAISADPLVLTAVVFKIKDPDAPGSLLEYECHVSAVELVPEQEVIEYQTLCVDGSFSALGRESWQLTATAVQDWSADGLTRFLWENAGKEAEITFGPAGNAAPAADEPHWIVTATLPRPSVGGEVSTFAVSELVFPVKGTPILDAAP